MSGHSGSWREIYQSSPTPLVRLSDDEFSLYVNRNGLPAEYAEQIRAKPVSGTLRMQIPAKNFGRNIRIRLSNEESGAPMVIGGASASLSNLPRFNAHITFDGEPGIALPPGAPAISDPIDLPDNCDGQLVLSFYIPGEIMVGGFGKCPVEVAPGNQLFAERLDDPKSYIIRPFVSAISRIARPCDPVIATFGDSLTDANCNFPESWPDYLLQRLSKADPELRWNLSNAGIGGNRLLTSGAEPDMGTAGLARLERDILRIDGLSHVIVLLGINDILLSDATEAGEIPLVRPEALIAWYRQVLTRVRLRGAKAVFGTLTPFNGSAYFTSEREAVRQAVNMWMRSSGEPDAVIDFDESVRDGDQPSRLLPVYDLGDYLHFSEAGSRALAAKIDLAIFASHSFFRDRDDQDHY